MVCGQVEVDIDMLRSQTRYQACSPTDAHVVFFGRRYLRSQKNGPLSPLRLGQDAPAHGAEFH